LVFFLINRVFPADVITSENCSAGQCEKLILEPQLSDSEKRFYENDAFLSQKDEFYRVIFQTETNQDTRVKLFATNALDQDEFIQEFELKKTDGRKIQEAVFRTGQKDTDFLFEKTELDGAKIFIKNIKVSKLYIRSEKELSVLQPTIFGKISFAEPTRKQEKNDFVFSQLNEPNVILGQVFQAESDFIAEIEMDIDVVKQGDGNGDKYALELREAEFDGVVPTISSRRLVTLKFNAKTIEQYRQINGKFRFPILAPVENGRFYFFGLDNERVEVNQFNHLSPRGSRESSGYSNGEAAVKYKGESFPAQGDFYFKIFGVDFEEVDGKKVLLGATVEDLGGGKMLFNYQPDESRYGFFDFSESTSDVQFDEKENSIFGEIEAQEESYWLYKFETVYPFKTFRVSGENSKLDLDNLKIAYSFDKEKWIEIPSKQISEKEISRIFDFSQTEKIARDLIYVKIYPKTDFPEGAKIPDEYGVKKFRFAADLISK
jgi:hypothetical protein